jgi:hypothetical protein
MGVRGAAMLLGAGLVLACGSSSSTARVQATPTPTPSPTPTPTQTPSVKPPAQAAGFLFYSTDQGIQGEVSDVSADEGGNVYVAAGSMVYAKARADQDFRAIDPQAALTANCWDASQIANKAPPGPPRVCPVISVAGAAPGHAVLGLKGVGVDYDYDAPWALDSGGADLVSFDGTTLRKERHVLLASPPGVICEHWANPPANTECLETWIDSTWMSGRKKMRQVRHIVVNHDRSQAVSYGDVFFGATHGSIGILAAHPEQRGGWIDYTKGDPAWADTKGVWEHEHPALTNAQGQFLTGESQALAMDPRTHTPWFANEVRTASLPGYATMSHPSWNGWWGDLDPVRPFVSFWGDAADATSWDYVTGLSFCDDGTLWVSSSRHGLKRVGPDGAWTQVDLPGYGNDASAVACDPSDGSVWVGYGWGGFGRWKGGWQAIWPKDGPAFARNPVASIQIDRWSSPRVVYIAQLAGFGVPGGVTVYSGP